MTAMRPPSTRFVGVLIAALLTTYVTVAAPSSVRALSFTIANGDVAGLISAIHGSNGAGPSTITLANDGAYLFSSADNSFVDNANALPLIADGTNLTIHGNGSFLIRDLSTTNQNRFRFFEVAHGASLTLDNLMLFGGSLVSTNGTNGTNGANGVAGNAPGVAGTGGAPGLNGTDGADANGGAIDNFGTLTVTNCAFGNNTIVAGNGGGGGNGGVGGMGAGYISAGFGDTGASGSAGGKGGNGGKGGSGGKASGGAISLHTSSTLTVVNTTFANNQVKGGSGGMGGSAGAGGPGGGGDSGDPGGTGGNGGAAGTVGDGGNGGDGNSGAIGGTDPSVMVVENSTLVGNSVVAGSAGSAGSLALGGYGGSGGRGFSDNGSSIGGKGGNGGNGSSGGNGGNGGSARGGAISTVSLPGGDLKITNSTFVTNTVTAMDGKTGRSGGAGNVGADGGYGIRSGSGGPGGTGGNGGRGGDGGNSGVAYGGAINVSESGSFGVINSTLSGNGAHSGAAGLAGSVPNDLLMGAGRHGNGGAGGGTGGANGTNGADGTPVLLGHTAGTLIPGGGGGIAQSDFDQSISNRSQNIENTIIANSTEGGNCLNVIVLFGRSNLQYNPNQGCDSFRVGDPMLGSLNNNGGPTNTLALLPGSAAIARGDAFACTQAEPNGAGGVDQRGVPRVGKCSIGAYDDPLLLASGPVPIFSRLPGGSGPAPVPPSPVTGRTSAPPPSVNVLAPPSSR